MWVFLQQVVHKIETYSYCVQPVHHFQAPLVVFSGYIFTNAIEKVDFKYNMQYSGNCHVLLPEYINKQTTWFLGSEQPHKVYWPPAALSVKNYCNHVPGHDISVFILIL
jgi:hypothetical protein